MGRCREASPGDGEISVAEIPRSRRMFDAHSHLDKEASVLLAGIKYVVLGYVFSDDSSLEVYTRIVTLTLKSIASRCMIPTSKIKCLQEFIVPGFNEYVKSLHDEARNSNFIWIDSGKSRSDGTHTVMIMSRLRFKYALRQCRTKEDNIRADALAE